MPAANQQVILHLESILKKLDSLETKLDKNIQFTNEVNTKVVEIKAVHDFYSERSKDQEQVISALKSKVSSLEKKLAEVVTKNELWLPKIEVMEKKLIDVDHLGFKVKLAFAGIAAAVSTAISIAIKVFL
jgi:predicted  nucleic acid-binding Zn-ribbon protein